MNNRTANRSIPGPTITRGPSASRPTDRAEADNADAIRAFALVAARTADDRKADDVLVLDVAETMSVTDMFVIASASNTRLVANIVRSIEDAVKEAGGSAPVSTEGLNEANWVLMDYAGFVVHVFLEETRRYYDLERLFADAKKIEWQTA
jgi:ribosome-associated protein